MPTILKCEVCKKRNQIRRTFRLCAKCFEMVSPGVQVAIFKTYTKGQDEGYTPPTTAFESAIAEAVGDCYLRLFGSKTPDKSVRDSQNNVINVEDSVKWIDLDSEELKGKVKVVYWETQEITVAYFKNEYPNMQRMSSASVTLRQV